MDYLDHQPQPPLHLVDCSEHLLVSFFELLTSAPLQSRSINLTRKIDSQLFFLYFSTNTSPWHITLWRPSSRRTCCRWFIFCAYDSCINIGTAKEAWLKKWRASTLMTEKHCGFRCSMFWYAKMNFSQRNEAICFQNKMNSMIIYTVRNNMH